MRTLVRNLNRLAYVAVLIALHAGYKIAGVLSHLAFLLSKSRQTGDILLFPYYPRDSPGYVARFGSVENLLREDRLRYKISFVDGQSATDYGSELKGIRPYWLYVSTFYRRLFQVLKARNYRTVYVQRSLFPHFPDQTRAHLEALLYKLNPNVTIDFYDADYLSNRALAHSTVKYCAKITVVNDYLRTYFRRLHPRVSVIPLAIDASRYGVKDDYTIRLPVKLFWWGSPRNGELLKDILPALKAVSAHFPITVVIVSAEQVRLEGIDVEWHRWDDRTAYLLLRAADIALYPAQDSEPYWGGMAFKVLEYMAAALPIVAAPHGLTPFARDREEVLVATNISEWERTLVEMIEDRALRERLGRNARTAVQRFHSPREAYRHMLAILLESDAVK